MDGGSRWHAITLYRLVRLAQGNRSCCILRSVNQTLSYPVGGASAVGLRELPCGLVGAVMKHQRGITTPLSLSPILTITFPKMASSNLRRSLDLLKGYEKLLLSLAAVLTAMAALVSGISDAVSTGNCKDVPIITPSSSIADSLTRSE